jgi:hypothetical protein
MKAYHCRRLNSKQLPSQDKRFIIIESPAKPQQVTIMNEFEIRAVFDKETISVFQAFDPAIATPAVKHQKLMPPFSYDRMTWIKPSFLWLMYRSEWAQKAGMERILQIRIRRDAWEKALSEAILTTPEPHVYPDAKAWRKALDAANIRVQWDPERNIRNQRLPYRSIQVGITSNLSETYAKKWIVKIDDITPLVRKIHTLILKGDFEAAEQLLPVESIYPVSTAIQKRLGM